MTATTLSSIEELYSILKQEAETYRQLLILSQNEQIALQEENLAALSVTVHKKGILKEHLVRWERDREQLTSQLAAELKLPAAVSLSDLIVHLSSLVSLSQTGIIAKLTELREGLIDMFEQLITLNYGNQLLIHAGLARVNATFDYLASLAVPSNGIYTDGSQSQKRQATSGNVLNCHI